jgi:hypothetical protein
LRFVNGSPTFTHEEYAVLAPDQVEILGIVEVDGEIYQLASLGADWYEAIRIADHYCVGTVGATGWMWRLHTETPDLMGEIVQAAIESGLVQGPPAD